MATVKKSKKKRIVILIIAVLVVAIVAGSVVTVNAKKGVKTVSLSTIATDSITESVSATGEVSAGATREYKTGTVATCKEVFVKVGDSVKKGDLLATFDTEGLDSQINSLESTYNSAKESYDAALKTQTEAKKSLESVDSRIKKLEKQLEQLKQASTTTTTTTAATKPSFAETTTSATTTTAPRTITQFSTSTTTTTTTTTTSTTMNAAGQAGGNISDVASQMSSSLEELTTTIKNLSNDVQTTNALTRVVMTVIASEIATGNYSKDAIANAVGDAVKKAIQEGLIEETKLIIDSGVAVQMIEASVKSINWNEIGKGIGETNDVKLASTELQLAALYTEKELFTVEASQKTVDAQKQVMDTSKSALDALKKSQSELQAGWTASIDGIITECNITSGGQTTLLETGIKLENMDNMVATISLGEYDIHKVSVGMPAVITTAYGEYTGEIVTIAPTATGGSSGSMLDSVGSMAGISGLSSLTASGAGVKCEVTIDNPDENIIVGFDANVVIQTGVYSDVIVVPTESISLAKDGAYVYKYDEAEGTVTKTKIETGAISDTAYEVVSGLSIGDKIVSTPASDYEDETFKVKVDSEK